MTNLEHNLAMTEEEREESIVDLLCLSNDQTILNAVKRFVDEIQDDTEYRYWLSIVEILESI